MKNQTSPCAHHWVYAYGSREAACRLCGKPRSSSPERPAGSSLRSRREFGLLSLEALVELDNRYEEAAWSLGISA